MVRPMLPAPSDPDITPLRDELREVDEAILALVARRQDLARKVGDAKYKRGLPIRVPSVERDVVAHARACANELGVSAELCDELMALLLRHSCCEQEVRRRVPIDARSAAKNALVVGGFGRMGQWMRRFLESSGYTVTLFDVRNAEGLGEPSIAVATDLVQAARDAQFIVIATPVLAAAGVIAQLAQSGTGALVFDLCSVKSPLLDAIDHAQRNGLRITSVHPMFGSEVRCLAGKTVLFCETGQGSLCDEAMALFANSAATLVRVPMAQHDVLMTQVLGLPHLVNLVFAEALLRSGEELRSLLQAAGTTFLAQAAVSRAVTLQGSELVRAIQAGNAAAHTSVALLREALDVCAAALTAPGHEDFHALMDRCRAYFEAADAAGPA